MGGLQVFLMSKYEYKQALINAEKLDDYLRDIGLDVPVIIYGAGKNGHLVAQHLLRIGASIKCFVDLNKDVQGDRPFFVDVVSPQTMKKDYNNEPIIITPYSGGNVVEEFLALADFPKDRIYRLEFDLVSFELSLSDKNQTSPSQLMYMQTVPLNPPITVFSIIYNTPEHYLRRSIESVLNQSFRNFEYFIVDHGSNDGTTSRIINEYAALDKRIKVYRTPVNVEVERQQGRESAKPREALFQEIKKRITTEYMCWLDSDDFFYDNFLEYSYTAIIKHHSDLVCVQSTTYEEDNHENVRFQWYPILSNEIIANTEKEKWLAFCETRMPEAGWSVLARSEIYLNAFHMSWSCPNGLTTDKLSAFEMLKESNVAVFTRTPHHTLTLRSTSSVGGRKSLDWRYMLNWYNWMISGWLGETKGNCERLNLDSRRCAYSLGQYVVEFIYSMSDKLTKYRMREELGDFYRELKLLIADEYISDIIDSRKIYREWYTKLADFFKNEQVVI